MSQWLCAGQWPGAQAHPATVLGVLGVLGVLAKALEREAAKCLPGLRPAAKMAAFPVKALREALTGIAAFQAAA